MKIMKIIEIHMKILEINLRITNNHETFKMHMRIMQQKNIKKFIKYDLDSDSLALMVNFLFLPVQKRIRVETLNTIKKA